MSSDITTEAVRLALGMQELRARVASINIANAGMADSRAQRIDFSSVQAALDGATAAGSDSEGTTVTRLRHAADDIRNLPTSDTGSPIQTDEQVAEMVAASGDYQVLGDALGRHFSLMRLAISGRN